MRRAALPPSREAQRHLDAARRPEQSKVCRRHPHHLGEIIEAHAIEVADAGRYQPKLWHDKDFPKIQILTIEGLLSGKERVEAPPQINPFAKAQMENKSPRQPGLL